MDIRLITLGLAAGMMVSTALPMMTSAMQHTSHTHVSTKQVDQFHTFLVNHGYISSTATHAEKRQAIIKFQKENNLRQSGMMDIHTRKAIRTIMKLPSIVETAIATPALSTLVAAVKAG